ncbi:unnamed protein product [Allacma fusca]|uniref:Receptor protein-tyrosine kinase n=1 Tax=Allacma fusca TaxID=39272 RepID=A0A8J2LTF1_9HEXA|nr:unnamed protein product [Allacma fusca]
MSKMFEHQLLVKIEVDNSDSTLAIEFVDDESSEIDYSAETLTTNMTSNVNQQCKDDLTVAEYRSQPMPKLYDLEYNKFECHFTPYFFVTPVLWFAEWKNGTRTLLFTDYGDKTSKETKFTWRDSLLGSTKIEFKIGSSHLEFRTLLGMNALTCEMWYWNSTDRAKNRKEIDVLESRAPKFSSRQESHSHPYGETLKLKCHVASEPPPTITWEFGGRILEGILGRENGSLDTVSTLTIPKAGSSESGRYICTATNFRGSDKKVFIVDVYDNSKTLWLTLGITSIVLIILLAVTLAGLYKQFLKQRARLTKMEINEFINGNKNATQENDYGHINVKQMAYNTEYELAWNQFQLEQQELGKGVHGVVYKGKIGEIPIAVKTVREGVEKEVLMALLDELKIMIYLGQHDHVVNLKGACTQFLEEGRAYVMVEFCPFGSLESFLRKNRKNFCRQMFSGDYANSCSPTGDVKVNVQYFSGQTLSSWSHQIALGMQYLEEKKVIHGDLAIRNILLTSIDQVKITDFGLSRQLINTDTYVKKQQGLLPWKYMAIEAMREFRFTSKSDVWSYGVTIWEIFTLGSTPYPGMNWTPEFMQLLEDNMRLYKPKHATDEMYKVMLECWAPEPEDRPSFADLEMCLRKFP